MVKASWKRMLTFTLVGLTTALLFFVAWPPQRNLLARSRRVVWLPSDPSGAISSPAQYYWQSDRCVVTDSFPDPDFAVEAVDVDTKASHPVASLSSWVWLDDQWNKSSSPDGQWALASVSHAAMLPKPGGKWAIEANSDEIAGDSTLVTLSDWQGRRKSTLTVFSSMTCGAFWLSDSRHWAIVLHTDNDWFLQVRGREQPKSLTLVPIRHELRAQIYETLGIMLRDQYHPGATSGNRVSFIRDNWLRDDEAKFLSISLNQAPALVEAAILSLPVGATFRAASISQDGQRIAWVLNFPDRQKIYPTAWESFREQYVESQPPPDPQPYPSEEVWVSQRDGRKMHEIGHLPLPDFRDRLSDLHWTPDGRRLSFVYKSYLYVMPADEPWFRHWAST